MIHSHETIDIGPGEVIEVTLDGPANVLLLDPANYDAFGRGRSYRYHGGFAAESPVELVPPHPGRWHLVVNLGGYSGHVRAEYRVLGPAIEAA